MRGSTYETHIETSANGRLPSPFESPFIDSHSVLIHHFVGSRRSVGVISAIFSYKYRLVYAAGRRNGIAIQDVYAITINGCRKEVERNLRVLFKLNDRELFLKAFMRRCRCVSAHIFLG